MSTVGNLPFCNAVQPLQNSSKKQPAHAKGTLVSALPLSHCQGQRAAKALSADNGSAQLLSTSGAQHTLLSSAVATAIDAAMPSVTSMQSEAFATVSSSDAASGHAASNPQKAQSCPHWRSHADCNTSMDAGSEDRLKFLQQNLQALADVVTSIKQSDAYVDQRAADKQKIVA